MMMSKSVSTAFVLASLAVLFTFAHPMENFRFLPASSSQGLSRRVPQIGEQHGLYERLVDEDKETTSWERKSTPKSELYRLIDWVKDHRQTARPLMYDMLINYLHVLECEEAYDFCNTHRYTKVPPSMESKYSRHNEEYEEAMKATQCHLRTLRELAGNAEHFTSQIKDTKGRSSFQYWDMINYKNDLARVARWASQPFAYKEVPLADDSITTKEQYEYEQTLKQLASVRKLIPMYQQ